MTDHKTHTECVFRNTPVSHKLIQIRQHLATGKFCKGSTRSIPMILISVMVCELNYISCMGVAIRSKGCNPNDRIAIPK